jgi:predicted transcriptional regulator
METTDQNEIINLIFETLSVKRNNDLVKLCTARFGIENYKIINETITFLSDKQIIERVVRDHYSLTTLGRQIVKQGGWLKYIEQESLENNEEEFIKQKEKDKLIYETKLARWQVKTFWYLFFLAIIGGIFGIISLILQLT